MEICIKKENMERKELSRFELAIVKRTAQNTKSLRGKRGTNWLLLCKKHRKS